MFECQGLLVALRRLARPGELPRRDVAELLVVALRLALGGLVLLPEMAAARFPALEGVEADELAEFQEVRDAPRLLEGRVQLLVLAQDRDVLPELLAERGDPGERVLEPLLVARHPALVPHDLPELLVE